MVSRDAMIGNLRAAYPALYSEALERLADLIQDVSAEFGEGEKAAVIVDERMAEKVAQGEEWAMDTLAVIALTRKLDGEQ